MLRIVMKYDYLALFLIGTLLAGCGQPGLLYLPTDKPPIHVEPDEKPETKEEAPKQESAPEAVDDSTQESKPQEVPQPTDTPPKAQ
jgi:predicted small lipoprotein YifL